jgi:hypothetical protein
MGASIFFTAAMIRAFKLARLYGNVAMVVSLGKDHCNGEECGFTYVGACVIKT